MDISEFTALHMSRQSPEGNSHLWTTEDISRAGKSHKTFQPETVIPESVLSGTVTKDRGKEIDMLYFKSCPKCVTGTIEQNNDSHGAYAQCLNCGFMRDISDGISGPEFKRLLAIWRKSPVTVEPEAVDAVA